MKTVFNNTESLIFRLRALYQKYGYRPYRMGKFEEYDLYSRNKDFLISDSVITFTDIGGRLMALKPDVTLSIIKNNRGLSGSTRKLYYNENVYRVSKGSNRFREIMQAGVECIGSIDSYAVGESLLLAAESLEAVGRDFVLDVSSLDILMKFVGKISDDRDVQDEIIKCVSEKNTHGILEICRSNEIDDSVTAPLIALVSLYGRAFSVMDELEALAKSAGAEREAEELKAALAIFKGSPLSEKIHLDFSVVSHLGYYNGVIFKGFVEGVPGAVLSGGQYDKLMKKMHRRSRAVGFAVYLDLLERIGDETPAFDADVLLIYGDEDPRDVIHAVNRLIGQGMTVLASRDGNTGARCEKTAELQNGEVVFS